MANKKGFIELNWSREMRLQGVKTRSWVQGRTRADRRSNVNDQTAAEKTKRYLNTRTKEG